MSVAVNLLEGVWCGTLITHASRWGAERRSPAELRIDYRSDLRIHLLGLQELSATNDGFAAHGVLTACPENDDVLLFWFDTFGHPPIDPLRGRWIASALELTRRTSRGENRTILSVREQEIDYSVEFRSRDADAFQPVAQGTFRRDEQTSHRER